ncbi:hypothetical protein K458DRAFT_106050 [Lentithecium fluviatile CBS 122367]|uniref:Tautomerase cis-CaaD-like domain-containing protein n=1 Tax=Lentithecium fluviatile CBS 122367 TaxID=1168545 RepID=A0A6G1JIU4_9PLEO|nr:hypothetical protein K458DRAFT_106050 [Lentithecium fluviatile CBS 122367]
MPHYEIFHSTPLTPNQCRQLAEAITTLHCTTFSVPSAFVNITFHHSDRGYTRITFVGGKEVRSLCRLRCCSFAQCTFRDDPISMR